MHRQPAQRNKPTFQHRLCIRISTCSKSKTLTITDLGAGMTRSDLINSLAVGSRLSHDALKAARYIQKNGKVGQFPNINTNNDSNIDDESSWSGSEDDNDSAGSITSENGSGCNEKPKVIIPCTGENIGGFYSAFCSLGKNIEVGTKVCQPYKNYSSSVF
jgi:hypothetical protein